MWISGKYQQLSSNHSIRGCRSCVYRHICLQRSTPTSVSAFVGTYRLFIAHKVPKQLMGDKCLRCVMVWNDWRSFSGFSCLRVFVTVKLAAVWGWARLASPGDRLYFSQLLSSLRMIIMNPNDSRDFDLSRNIRCETCWHIFTPKNSSICCPKINLKPIKLSKVVDITSGEWTLGPDLNFSFVCCCYLGSPALILLRGSICISSLILLTYFFLSQ